MANYYMLGGDGKEYGPVSTDQLRQWLGEGRANAQTQVRLADGGTWTPMGSVTELNPPPAAQAAPAMPAPSPVSAPLPSYATFSAPTQTPMPGDVTATVKRLAAAQVSTGIWLMLGAALAIINDILGVVNGMSSKYAYAGLLFCWVPVLTGVLLFQSCGKAQQAALTGQAAQLTDAFKKISLFFKITLILWIVTFVAGMTVGIGAAMHQLANGLHNGGAGGF